MILYVRSQIRKVKSLNQKALFFDIDGTLWRRGNPVPNDAILAIEKARAAGHLAFINTGRSKGHLLDESLLSINWDGVVSGCGTLVEVRGKTIHEILIPTEEFDRVL